MTLTPAAANVEVGKTIKLTAIVAPADATDKIVVYKSNDDTIATVVNDGTVTGVTDGTADITVTAGGKTAKSTITVITPAEE